MRGSRRSDPTWVVIMLWGPDSVPGRVPGACASVTGGSPPKAAAGSGDNPLVQMREETSVHAYSLESRGGQACLPGASPRPEGNSGQALPPGPGPLQTLCWGFPAHEHNQESSATVTIPSGRVREPQAHLPCPRMVACFSMAGD